MTKDLELSLQLMRCCETLQEGPIKDLPIFKRLIRSSYKAKRLQGLSKRRAFNEVEPYINVAKQLQNLINQLKTTP